MQITLTTRQIKALEARAARIAALNAMIGRSIAKPHRSPWFQTG